MHCFCPQSSPTFNIPTSFDLGGIRDILTFVILFQFMCHHTASQINFTFNISYHWSFKRNCSRGAFISDVWCLNILLSSYYLFAMMYVLQELPCELYTAMFSGKFAFGFFKSNMNFPGPKDTKSIYFSALPPNTF